MPGGADAGTDRDRADQPGRAGLRHLLPPAVGPHRLPGLGHRRHRGQPRHRPAAPPGVAGRRPRHLALHQLARRRHDGASSPSTTRCSYVGPDVATICVGQAASAAAVLLAAGAKGKRYALPNARVLIHQPHGGMQGQSTDIERAVTEIVEMRRRMVDILVEATGQPAERITTDIDRDYILRGRGRRRLRARRPHHRAPPAPPGRRRRLIFVAILRCASAGSYSLRSAMRRASLRCAGPAGRTEPGMRPAVASRPPVIRPAQLRSRQVTFR